MAEGRGAVAGPVAGPYDEPSKGLDGDAIDAILRARMTEGIRIGEDRGRREISLQFSEVHDGGYAAGVRATIATWQAQSREIDRELAITEALLQERLDNTPDRQANLRAALGLEVGRLAGLRSRLRAT